MSNVEFEEDKFLTDRFSETSNNQPKMVRFLLKTGLIKDEKQANYVMIGIAVVAVLLTFFVIKSFI